MFRHRHDDTVFQNLGEEVGKGGKTRRQASVRGGGKEEDQKRETLSTGGYHQTSSLGYQKVFAPPKQTDSGYGGRIAAKSGGGADGQPPLKKPRREDKTLHPSWQAKKKMEESAATSSGEEDRVLGF